MATQSSQHILERRTTLLAQHLRQRIADTTLALQAAGGRIPFHTKLSQGDALDWWAQHRNDALGKQALAGMSPLTQMQLDNALNARARSQPGNFPEEGTPGAPPPVPQDFGPSEVGGSPDALQ